MHEDLHLSDRDLGEFIGILSININAPSFDTLYNEVIDLICSTMKCDRADAELYYFAGALAVISDLSSRRSGRSLSKSDFIKTIDKKKFLFTKWQRAYLGEKEWIRKIRASIYPSINSSSRHRYIVIDCEIGDSELGEIALLIDAANKKLSSTSTRDPFPHCPIFCLPKIQGEQLVALKKTLHNSSWKVIDGYPFNGSGYIKSELELEPPKGRPTLIKILNSLSQLNDILKNPPKVSQTLVFFKDDSDEIDEWKTVTDLYSFNVSTISRIKEILI